MIDKDITIAAQKLTIGVLAILLAAALIAAVIVAGDARTGLNANQVAAEEIYYTKVRACVDGGYDWYVAIGDMDEYCIGHRGDEWYGEPYWR